MISLVIFFLSSVIHPCKLVFCFQDAMEVKKTCKGEKKKAGKGKKMGKTKRHVKPLLVLEANNKQPEEIGRAHV